MSYTASLAMHWAPEDAAYITSLSERYPGALDSQIEWTREALADVHLLEVTPYPRARPGAGAFIRYSPTAGRVLLVLAYRDLNGDWHGLNAWRAPGRDLTTYKERISDGEKA
ncbi:MAG: hypothetical protein ACYDAQ_06065 [Mycobacteriales bacterium]